MFLMRIFKNRVLACAIGTTILATILTLVYVRAQEGPGPNIIIGAAVAVFPGDKARVSVSNISDRAVPVRIRLLNAEDFTALFDSGIQNVQGRSSAFFLDDFQSFRNVIAVVQHGGPARRLRVSFQVTDSEDQTQVWTDMRPLS